MLKYLNVIESFTEVPTEISLYIPLTGCRVRCPQCNSKWLWEFQGEELDLNSLRKLVDKHRGITCLCLGGGEGDIETLNLLFAWAKSFYGLKTCWYTGLDTIPKGVLLENLDYVKIGHFNGIPLNEKGTNQKFLKLETTIKDNKIHNFNIIDLTSKFQNKNED